MSIITALNKLNRYIPFVVTALVLSCLVGFMYPYCKYYIDPDGIAYLTIANRYAAGAYDKAINGYWSPWSCWIAALFVKTGIETVRASIIANVLGAIGLLFVSQMLFIKYRIQQHLQWLLCGALAIFLSYAVYVQSFDDIWECYFLLYALRIMVNSQFKHKPFLWVLAGFVGALAYFAKAYSFPFFILDTLCIVFFITRAWQRANVMKWLGISGAVIGTMIVCSSPWLYLLYHKYGMLTTSTAGTLNTSWYLVGHPYWHPNLTQLLPPVYGDSPSYWEDPWFVNNVTPHFYSSPKLFVLQIVKLVQNVLKFVQCMNALSAFMMFVWLIALGLVSSRKMRCFFADNKIFIPALSFLIFPVGFFLINFEPRYIWYMLPLSMVLGALVIQKMQKILAAQTVYSKLIPFIFSLSYILWPVWDMKNVWKAGKDDAVLSKQLKEAGFSGSYAGNLVFGDVGYTGIQRIAWHTGSSYYPLVTKDADFKDLLTDIRRYRVKYFLLYRTGSGHTQAADIKDENGIPFPELKLLNCPIRVFKMY